MIGRISFDCRKVEIAATSSREVNVEVEDLDTATFVDQLGYDEFTNLLETIDEDDECLRALRVFLREKHPDWLSDEFKNTTEGE